jgi:hypothetical protein
MSSPRKFAEKIALLQQKQAEGDAAFNTILYEVEAAKQKADRTSSTKSKLDVPTRKYEMSNGMNNSNSNHYTNQPIKFENDNGFDRLSLPPDNSSWRRTYSDSSLHQSMMPVVIAHYHAQHNNDDNNQQLNFDMNDAKLEPPPYTVHHLQPSNCQYQTNHHYDLNNNNYANDPNNMFYPPISQQNMGSSPTNNALLGPRYSGGNVNSNVLMLPPNQNPRGNGGSLPDLRLGSVYNNNNNNQQISFSTAVPSQTSTSQHCFRSSPPQQNSNGDLFMLEPQQQQSNIGPLKQSPIMRRRHSPIGDVKPPSSRRHSPSPETQHNAYRVEPQSPQSQSSYSPQNSPHLLPSPGNELAPFSPQQQQSTDNQQHYFTLSNHFDQITLDNNYYTQQQQQQQQQQQPSPPSIQQHRNHSSLPTTPGGTTDFRQRNFYPPFIDDIPPPYCHNQTTNVAVKSPTIPNIILTDPDSSKLDLSKELANDFSNPFDSLIDGTDFQLNADDFLLNAADLSVDPIICDDTFRMER